MNKHFRILCLLAILVFCVFFPGLVHAELHKIGEKEYFSQITPDNSESYGMRTDWYDVWTSDHQVRSVGRHSFNQGGPCIKCGFSGQYNGVQDFENISTYLPVDTMTHSWYMLSTNIHTAYDTCTPLPGENIHDGRTMKYLWTGQSHDFRQDSGKEVCWYCGYVKGSNNIPQHEMPFNLSEADNVLKITYDANGGVNTPAPQAKEEGKSVTLSAQIPERSGYYFMGWSKDKKAKKPDYKRDKTYQYGVDEDLTLYAVWEKGYLVTFDAMGGTGGPSQQTKAPKIPLTLSKDVPIRNGYAFTGWDTNKKATRIVYKNGDEYTADKKVTLYAVWEAAVVQNTPSPSCVISYDANGGTGGPSSQTVEWGMRFVLSGKLPTREGYDFLGWNTHSASSAAAYYPGATYTFTKDYSLYAVWKRSSIGALPEADYPNRIGEVLTDFSSDLYAGYTGQCVSYAKRRFEELTGIKGSETARVNYAREMLEKNKNSDTVIVIYGANNIEAPSMAVTKGNSKMGHVLIVEYVERDGNGNPVKVYYTEANPSAPKRDGQLKCLSFEAFLRMEPSGYIVPK